MNCTQIIDGTGPIDAQPAEMVAINLGCELYAYRSKEQLRAHWEKK
ncbi:hypothetical protein IC235_06350 [Hymenobacter sp. BT664]|uniref:Uncharacterized protein n=1 Tax=Hymenobacter montanus TaxID=2771359 RepID=A0A927BB56_9BACT|nr:hypothetical protein [Hymenobacter montanus]